MIIGSCWHLGKNNDNDDDPHNHNQVSLLLHRITLHSNWKYTRENVFCYYSCELWTGWFDNIILNELNGDFFFVRGYISAVEV